MLLFCRQHQEELNFLNMAKYLIIVLACWYFSCAVRHWQKANTETSKEEEAHMTGSVPSQTEKLLRNAFEHPFYIKVSLFDKQKRNKPTHHLAFLSGKWNPPSVKRSGADGAEGDKGRGCRRLQMKTAASTVWNSHSTWSDLH